METNKQKCYKVYSKRVASLLCKEGFFIVGTEPNNDKPWLNVYLFEYSDSFREALDKIINGGCL